jgi:hypothetical protein
MTRGRKARVEGAVSTAQAINDGMAKIAAAKPMATPEEDALSAIMARFKEEHPEEWGELSRWPTESGILRMIEVLSK